MAGGLLGLLLGIGGMVGVQRLSDDSDRHLKEEVPTVTNVKQGNNFERVPEDPSGPYVITPKGEKYHDPGCSRLKSSEKRHVNEQDARDAGLTPCSVCLRSL